MMKIRICFLLAVLVLITGELACYGEPIHPVQVAQCLEKPMNSNLTITMDMNPYYLRGDFDGDGKVDYAVAVRGNKSKRNGILVCTGNNRQYILGADNPLIPPFSDMAGDNFVAPDWVVFTRSQALELGKYVTNVPHPLPRILAETIAMIWEDGISLIYWDGKQFKWAGSVN